MKKFVQPEELVGKTIAAISSDDEHLLVVCGEEFTYVREASERALPARLKAKYG